MTDVDEPVEADAPSTCVAAPSEVEPVDDTPTVAVGDEPVAAAGFAVHLDNFEGPFDLLLQLIAKHKLDITEVALSQVTDEFIAHTKALGDEWELEQTTSFLLVASTLLDLKVVRLLPSADVEDEDDLALLEARDLLFARLLQYRAFKQVAAQFEERLLGEAKRVPRSVGLEPRFANLLPEVLITIGLDDFARLAERALMPKEEPAVTLAHLHGANVSVRDEAATIVERMRRSGTTTFRSLAQDAPNTLTTVARFLALLELFRAGDVSFDQVTPLGELTIRWTGAVEGDVEIEIEDEYDDLGPKEDSAAEEVTDADIARIAMSATSTGTPEPAGHDDEEHA